MLVLSRKVGEKVIIDGQIVVTVLSVRGDHVRIGFQAPPHVTVHREEIARKIARQRWNPELELVG